METGETTRLITNEYTEVYRRLPLKLQFAYGVGHVLNDVCASMWFTYLLVFFHLVLEFSSWQAGFMLLIGQLAVAIEVKTMQGCGSRLAKATECKGKCGTVRTVNDSIQYSHCHWSPDHSTVLLGSSFVFIIILVVTATAIADALSTPFVGFHSDKSDNFWLCRYGRRKTWHLIGTVCVLVTFPFIFAPCLNCEGSHKWAQMFYYCVFISIFQFGWAAVQISHLSLIPELTPNEHDRTKLTAIRYGFTVISNLTVYLITWAVLHMGSGEENKVGPDDAPKFQRVVWVGISLGLVCSMIFHFLVKEEGAWGSSNVRGTQMRTSVLDLITSVEVYQVAIVYMSTRLFVNLSQVFIPLYLHETLDMTASALALIPLIMFLGSFLTSFTIEKLNRFFGRRLAYVFGVILGISACVWIKFGDGDDFRKYQIQMIAVMFGACGSIILVTSLGITADLIGDKTDSGAFVYGIMSFTDKLANGIAVVIIQDQHGDKSDNKYYYRDVLAYVCGISALLGAITVITFLKPGRTDVSGCEQVPNYNSINTPTQSLIGEEIQPSLIS